MSVEQQNGKLTVEVLGTRGAPSSVRSAAAARVIDAHGGSVSHRDDALVLALNRRVLRLSITPDRRLARTTGAASATRVSLVA